VGEQRLDVILLPTLWRTAGKQAKASPEKCASAKNTGNAPTTNSTSAHGEKCTSSTPKLISTIRFWISPNDFITRANGRVEASRRTRTSLS
jgi:hypothetical protein